MPLVNAITKHGNSAGIILEQAILKLVGWEWARKGNSIVLKRHLIHGRRSTDTPAEK